MGIISSCPFGETSDLSDEIESVIVRSISFGKGEDMTDARSVSFNGRDSDPTISKALGSGKLVVEGSVSFKRSGEETVISVTPTSAGQEMDSSSKSIANRSIHSFGSENFKDSNTTPQTPILDTGNGQHAAAVKLQKVYKSFRTRRKLADCAVLVEQSWWKLLDFAELKHSSISFFGIEKQETAVSRWSRAKNRAAKVGKGLSKNSRAQKLALQHWLEAIDPRHRYGHNLHFYYDRWLNSQSQEPFFYWLDIGEGKEVNLVEKCPRSKLQHQCIKYLGPMERKAYEVEVVGGKFFYKQSGELLDTRGGSVEDKWIFVLSASRTLYVGKKRKGTFQHSSFLAGGVTTAAGRLVAENGILKAVWPHSGHYRPTEENFNDFIAFLKEHNVDLRDVTTCSEGDEHASLLSQKSSLGLRYQPSEVDFSHLNRKELTSDSDDVSTEDSTDEKNDEVDEETEAAPEQEKRSRMQNLSLELTDLEIPNRNEISGSFKNALIGDTSSLESSLDGYQTAEETLLAEEKPNVANTGAVHEEYEEDDVELIPEESIVKRIRSHRRMNSYQLGEQLPCKWTSGVGPRIGCVRDYPSGLQVQALEQVHLSPRSAMRIKSFFSPRSSPRVLPSPRYPSKFAPKAPPTP